MPYQHDDRRSRPHNTRSWDSHPEPTQGRALRRALDVGMGRPCPPRSPPHRVRGQRLRSGERRLGRFVTHRASWCPTRRRGSEPSPAAIPESRWAPASSSQSRCPRAPAWAAWSRCSAFDPPFAHPGVISPCCGWSRRNSSRLPPSYRRERTRGEEVHASLGNSSPAGSPGAHRSSKRTRVCDAPPAERSHLQETVAPLAFGRVRPAPARLRDESAVP